MATDEVSKQNFHELVSLINTRCYENDKDPKLYGDFQNTWLC